MNWQILTTFPPLNCKNNYLERYNLEVFRNSLKVRIYHIISGLKYTHFSTEQENQAMCFKWLFLFNSSRLELFVLPSTLCHADTLHVLCTKILKTCFVIWVWLFINKIRRFNYKFLSLISDNNIQKRIIKNSWVWCRYIHERRL